MDRGDGEKLNGNPEVEPRPKIWVRGQRYKYSSISKNSTWKGLDAGQSSHQHPAASEPSILVWSFEW